MNTTFKGRDCRFVWRRSSNTGSFEFGSEPYGANSGAPDPATDYLVKMSRIDGTDLRTEYMKDNGYVYTYENNFQDNAGVPLREFRIKVWARNVYLLSAIPAQLEVSNPPPAVPGSIAALAGGDSIAVACVPAADADLAGIIVWRSTSQGFTPSDANRVYKGPDSAVVFTGLVPRTTYYFRLAAFDSFGTDTLNTSGEFSATTLYTVGGVEVLGALPAFGQVGRVIYLTTDGKIYRDSGTAWVKAVDGADLIAASVTAQSLFVATLAAISANLGSITAGDLTMNTSGFIRGGQTAYNTGVGFFLGYSGGAYKFSLGDPNGSYIRWNGSSFEASALSSISANLGSITAGNITLDTAGYIKGGQTAYNTGAGFFLGHESSVPKFSLGDPDAEYLTWTAAEGLRLSASAVKIFTPLITANWIERSNPKNANLNDVTWNGSIFVAVGSADGADAYIVTSADGITWTERANPKNVALASVTWNGSIFVAVGNIDGADAYIVTSADGITWTERANPKNVALFDVTWNGSIFVAVGFTDGADAYIVTSADGITWTERANPKNVQLDDVTWNGSIFVAVGQPDGTDAYIVTSSDGTTWIERANPRNVALFAVAWNGSVFAALGAADGTDAYIVTSSDGTTWTERINPKNIGISGGCVWNGGFFVAVGNADGADAYILISENGKQWVEKPNPRNTNLFAVVWNGNFFTALGATDGTDAYIITSLKV